MLTKIIPFSIYFIFSSPIPNLILVECLSRYETVSKNLTNVYLQIFYRPLRLDYRDVTHYLKYLR